MTAASDAGRIAALERTVDALRAELCRDTLTGIGNRRALRGVRGGWVVFCDLDNFGRAQTAHPDQHEYGDAVLQEFGAFLASVTRQVPGRASDRIAARWGGDEFAVWCPSREGALRIRDRVRSWRSTVEGLLVVTCSAGIGRTLKNADAALRLHKDRRKES